jgi:hypothetical protein
MLLRKGPSAIFRYRLHELEEEEVIKGSTTQSFFEAT